MEEILYKDIVTPELLSGAIEHRGHTGFYEDYTLLHALLRIYKPKRFLEVGTNLGVGTTIIKNALGVDSEVFSLDLPNELSSLTQQHPTKEGGSIGERCQLPYTQLYGDSRTFDFSKYYPINGWYIDAEHVYDNVVIEASKAAKSNADIVIFHDSDEPEVYRGIVDAFECDNSYKLYRVIDTRIAFAVKCHLDKFKPFNKN